MPRLSKDVLAGFRRRAKKYSLEARDDINLLLSHFTSEREKKSAKGIDYSEAFQEAWTAYPKKSGKADAFATWQARIKDGIEEHVLLRIVKAYIKTAWTDVTPKPEKKFLLNMSSLFGTTKRRYEDFLDEAKNDERDQPDWCESAGKLIRTMDYTERVMHDVPYPLPLHLDHSRNFGA